MKKENFFSGINILLFAIILTAFLFRIWGITFDLPLISHPDEPNEVHRALRLGAGNFEIERVGKGGYYYLLFIEYGFLFIILKILGTISSVKDFMLYFFNDPSNFYIIGRATTAVIGTLNVWITYLIGKKIKGENVGLIAALFMAFSSVSALHAHYITVDVPMTGCVLTTTYFSLKIYESDKLKNYIFAGFFSALSIMTKLSAAPVIFVVILAHYFKSRSQTNRIISKNLAIYIICTVLIYFIGEPGAVLHYFYMIKGFLFGNSSAIIVQNTYEGVGKAYLIIYYFEATISALGWPLFLLILSGIIYSLYRLTKYDVLLLMFPIILYFFLILAPRAEFLHNRRYILPTLPFLYIFGAQFIYVLFNWAKQFLKVPEITLAIIVIAICLPRSIVIVKQDIAFSKPGSNILSKNWIEQNIPENSKILLEGHPGAPQERAQCPIQDKKENMYEYADKIAHESPMGALYIRKKASTQKGKEYDLVIIKSRSPWLSLNEAKQLGVQYVVVDSNIILDSEKANTKPDVLVKSRSNFYDQLTKDPDVKLLKVIDPPFKDYKDDATKRNHYIEIYQLNS